MKVHTLAVAATLALVPGAFSLAQIAPPPTEAPAPTQPYSRAQPTPEEAANAVNAANAKEKPSPSATAAAAAAAAARAEPKKPAVELPNLPYESLVKKDAAGRVIRLTQPVTWAACRRNPTITPDDWKRLDPVIAARKAECESIAVKNLDLTEKVDSGEIERITGDAKQIVQTIRGVYTPLKPSGGDFCTKLGKDGTLTEVQSVFSQKIEGEYNAAIRAELRAEMKPKDDPGAIASIDIVRYMFLEQIDETMCCYRDLLAEASTSLDRALPKVSPGTAAKVSGEARAVSSATDPAKRIELLRALLNKLDLQERRALLSAVIESRPK